MYNTYNNNVCIYKVCIHIDELYSMQVSQQTVKERVEERKNDE